LGADNKAQKKTATKKQKAQKFGDSWRNNLTSYWGKTTCKCHRNPFRCWCVFI